MVWSELCSPVVNIRVHLHSTLNSLISKEQKKTCFSWHDPFQSATGPFLSVKTPRWCIHRKIWVVENSLHMTIPLTPSEEALCQPLVHTWRCRRSVAVGVKACKYSFNTPYVHTDSRQSALGLKYTKLLSAASEPHTPGAQRPSTQRNHVVLLSQVCDWLRSHCNINSREKVNPLKEEAKKARATFLSTQLPLPQA